MFGRHELGRPRTGVLALALILAACGGSTSPSAVPSPTASPTGTSSPAPGGSSAASPSPDATPRPYEPATSEIGQVIATEPLVLRSEPGTDARQVGALSPHMRFRFLEGPASASGYGWYRVRVGDLEGWVADGLRSDGGFEPWLAVVDNDAIAVALTDESPAPRIDLVRPSGERLAPLTDLGDALNTAALPGPSHGNLLALSCGVEANNMAWSWDGRLLAFTFGYCENGAAFTVDTVGVRNRIFDGRTMALSPDARHIAAGENVPFQGCTDPGCESGPWELHLVDLETGAASQITHSGPFVAVSWPDWSPDGRLVAFVADTVGNLTSPGRQLVWTVDVASGTERRLANGQMPRWSPDGTRLAVLRQASFQVQPTVWIIRADGSDQAELDQGWDVRWSPAGDRIAYWRSTGIAEPESVVSAPDGSGQVIAPVSGRALGWSPDGRELLIAGESALWRWTPGEPTASVIVQAAYVSDAAWQPRLTPISALSTVAP